MAVSVVITTVKIDITSTGSVEETWATCVTAINTDTPGTITGAGTSGDPYIITTPSNYRELEFSSGTIVRFEQDTYLTWDTITTSGAYAIDFATGCDVTIEDGCYFDMSDHTTALVVYATFYGGVHFEGLTGNHITWTGVTRNYMYARNEQDYDYVDFIVTNIGTAYGMYFNRSSQIAQPDLSYTNINITSPNGTTSYGIYMPGGDFSNVIFDNIDIGGDFNYSFYAVYNTCPKFSNSHFHDAINGGFYFTHAGGAVTDPYLTSKDDTQWPTNKMFQSFAVLDNCTFTDNDNGVYSGVVYYNSKVIFKDCTFVGDTYSGTQDGTHVSHSSRIVFVGTTTYTNIDIDIIYGTNGVVLHGHEVDITVLDINDTPIENAAVTLIQSEGYEKWVGFTNSDGELKNMHGDAPVLIEKEETTLGNYVQWSDSIASGRYHTIMVKAEGYLAHEQQIEITEDKDITINIYVGNQIPISDSFKHITHKIINGAS